MGTPTEELNKAVSNLVESKTFTVEAADCIARLRATVATVTAENTMLQAQVASLSKRVSDSLEENGRLAKLVANVEGRETAVQQRECRMHALETEKAVAHARAETYKECVGLVFRNAEFRSSMCGSAPNPAYGQPNNSQAYSSVVGVAEDTTRTQT
jgi:hypothetical protein